MASAPDPVIPAVPVVSISVTAYQHAAFLAECLDSILAQRTSFPYEILLGEDGSTDGTREIAIRYAEAHPDKIRLFLRDRSQVIMIDGRATGRGNFLNNFQHARGRYLCHLDGDDFWNDPERLRIMVERMEAESDLSMAFHNAWNLLPNGRQVDYVRQWTGTGPLRVRYSGDDLITQNWIPTGGLIWRIGGERDVPEVWRTTIAGDWVINLFFAQRGPIGCIDKHMSVRRVHGGGLISGMDPVRKMELNLRMLGIVDRFTHAKHSQPIAKRRVEILTEALRACVLNGRTADARGIWKQLSGSPSYSATLRERMRWMVLVRWPRLARLIHRARS